MHMTEQLNRERLTNQYLYQLQWIEGEHTQGSLNQDSIVDSMVELSHVDPNLLPYATWHCTLMHGMSDDVRDVVVRASNCGLLRIFDDLRKHPDASDRLCIQWTAIGWTLFGRTHNRAVDEKTEYYDPYC